jgi:WD40 repeat protein
MSILAFIAVASLTGHHKIAPSRRAPSISVTIGPIIQAFRPIALAAAPSGSTFAAAMEDGSVRIIDSKTHKTVRVLRTHVQPVYALAFSNSGKLLASGDESGRVWIENVVTGAAVRGYRRHTKGIQKLSFNAFDNILISTGKDDQINVYDLTSREPKEVRAILGHGENFYSAVFDPQSSREFTVGMLGGGLREYDAMTGKVVNIMADPNGQGIWDLAYNPNGTREVTGGRDGDAIVWDTRTGLKLNSLKGHQDWVVSTAVSPNGRLAATASTDRTVKIWSMFSYGKIADLSDQCAVGSPLCFTSDGGSLISVTDTGFLQFNSLNPIQAMAEPMEKSIGTVPHRSRRASS